MYFYSHVISGSMVRNNEGDDIRRGQKSVEVLSGKQYQKILGVVNNLRDKCLIELGFEHGSRQSEMGKYSVSGIDFEERKVKKWDTKKKEWRKVGISAQTAKDLEMYIQTAKVKDVLFPGRKPGTGITGKQCDNILKHWAEVIGIKEVITWHCLRRTLSSRAPALGLTIQDIMFITGDTERTINKYYQMPSPTDMGSKLDKAYEVV